MDAIHYATEIVKKLKNSGHTAYFAGGWVRDFLMKHPSSDIDIATDAPPEKILDLFPHTILVGLAFGVVVVVIDGHQFEVATFRKDFGYSDGRKPDKIEFSDSREDAIRRDFTINGMFYDPLEHVVHDFVQGADDLQKGIIRAIGNPYERFLEDRLRMIRAVRFSCRFAFSIDPETQEAIVSNADALFPAVAKERVWMEFEKMAKAPSFDHALVELHRLGLLEVIFPRLQGLHLNEVKHRTACFRYFSSQTPTVIYLCELFPDANVGDLLEIFQSLHVSNKELKLIEARQAAQPFLRDSELIEPIHWAHFYAHPHTSLLLQVAAAKLSSEEKFSFLDKHDEKQKSLAAHIERIILKKPLVAAALLKENGIQPGINMGLLIKEAEKISVNQDIQDPYIILELLQKSPLWQNKETP
jgi:poly(A) polymerase